MSKIALVMEPGLTPPRLRRVAFWALNWRVPPQYRPWVARQVQRPDFQRRRQAALITFIVLFVAGPQLLQAGRSHGWYLALLLLYVGVVVVALIRAKPLTEVQRAQALAFHGVTPAGGITPPDARWAGVGSPRVTAGLFAATRATLAPSLRWSTSRSHALFIPAQFQGVHLRYPRQVGTSTRGIRLIAADVVAAHGELLGVAAWRIIDSDNAFGWAPGVDAVNALAAEITPTTGYATSGRDGHRDPLPSCLGAD